MGKAVIGVTAFVALVAVGVFYVGSRTIPGTAEHRADRRQLLDTYGETYTKDWGAGDNPSSPSNNADETEHYFTITTDFMEWGWGDAIHMAPMHPERTFKQSMQDWEAWFGQRLGITAATKVADLGMGIGGPMRRMAAKTGADITGVTICKHQIERANALTPDSLKDQVTYVQSDYSHTPLPSDTFDVVYFMESLSHCENREHPLAEAFRILKPGGTVGAWQWMLQPHFDYENATQMEWKRGMEYGGGLRNLNTPKERAVEFKKAGFDVIEESVDMQDIAEKLGWTSWVTPLTDGHDMFTMFASSHWGRKLTSAFVWTMETAGVIEKGTYHISMMMEHCGRSTADAGEGGVFTPLWLTIAKKPLV